MMLSQIANATSWEDLNMLLEVGFWRRGCDKKNTGKVR